MMNILDMLALRALPPSSGSCPNDLDVGSLEDRVLLSATPLDAAATDLDDLNTMDAELADVAQTLEISEVGSPHDGLELAPELFEELGESELHDHLDAFGNEYHALTELPTLNVDPVDPTESELATSAAFSVLDTFLLHSNPDASHTIYLDFDGHLTTGTYWNDSFNNGNDIYTAAYDFDGDSTTFSDAELERIHHIWQRVAEDFIPFDVNVTTEDPGLDALIKSGSGDLDWGTRVVIGGSSYDWLDSGAGGVAYVGSFNWSTDTPAFVFEEQLGNGNEKYVAEATSHEIGHTLGLGHDGSSGSSYYSGHGSGDTGWAPIMGSGYYKNLTQWSSGEYSSASNAQDDLAIIVGNNGFGYRVDDHGDVDNLATSLAFAGSSVSGSGIIEQNTDVDVFQFNTDGGLINLQINPFERGPNLDLLVELYDSASNLILASNPVDTLYASIDVTLNAGQYFLHVTGTGAGDPLGTGYSDYGSLGQYWISGMVAPSSADSVSIAPADAVQSEGDGGSTALTFTVTRTGDLSDATSVDYFVAGSGAAPASADDFGGGVLPSGTITFAANESSQTISVNVAGDQTIEPDEDFTVTLTNPGGDTQIAGSQASGRILNDDAVDTSDSVSVAATDANKSEGDSGSTAFTFTVTRTGHTADATTVDYTVTGSGTDAAQVNDFAGAISGTVSFAAGETTKTITVNVAGDAEIEADEGFTVTLSNAGGDTLISGGSADGTILNDDVAPPSAAGITVTPISGLVTDEEGSTASFTVVLDYQPTADVTLQVSSLDTTEGTVDVSLLTFTAANWNVAQRVMVTGADDTVRDGNMSYTIQLAAAQSADANYDGLDADDVQLTNQDNERGKKGGGGTDSGGGNGNGKGNQGGGPKKGALPAEIELGAAPSTDDRNDQGPPEHGRPDPVDSFVTNQAALLKESGGGSSLGEALRRLFAEDRGKPSQDENQPTDLQQQLL